MKIFFLLIEGFEFILYFWYISLFLIFLLVSSLIVMKKKNKLLSKSQFKFLIPAPIIAILIAILGVMFFDTQNSLIQYLILGLVLLYVLYEIVILVKLKGYRLFYFSLLSIFLLYLGGEYVVAAMSIANDWI